MPTVDVRVPGLLARFTGGDGRVAVEAATVREAVHGLVDCHPAVGPHLLDDRGALRVHLQLFHEGTQVEWTESGDVAVEDGDEVVVLQAVSGG